MKKLFILIAVLLMPAVLHADAAEDISQDDLLERMEEKKEQLILDVRSNREYKKGHIKGAVHIPFDELPDRLKEVEDYKNKDIILYCQSGRRAGIAAKTLDKAGFTHLLHLDGDWGEWIKNDRPVAKPGE